MFFFFLSLFYFIYFTVYTFLHLRNAPRGGSCLKRAEITNPNDKNSVGSGTELLFKNSNVLLLWWKLLMDDAEGFTRHQVWLLDSSLPTLASIILHWGETGAVNIYTYIYIKKENPRLIGTHFPRQGLQLKRISSFILFNSFLSLPLLIFLFRLLPFHFFSPSQNQSGQTRDRLLSESETIKPGGATGTRRPVQFFFF